MERRIRQSQLGLFRECRRHWEIEYLRGIELDRPPSASKGSRDLGSLVHRLAESYYAGRDWQAGLDDEIKARIDAGAWSEEWADHYVLARIMFEGYVEWLGESAADVGERVVMVEQNLEAPVLEYKGDTVILTGKPDLVTYNEMTEQHVITDTKTVSRLDSVLVHAPQLLTYAMLIKLQHGIDVDLARTNQLKKVKRTARAAPPFYGRPELVINTTLLRTHWAQTIGQLKEMVDLMQYWDEKQDTERESYDELFYPNPGIMRCNGCDARAICQNMDDGSNYEYIIRNHYRPKPDTEHEESVE